GVYANTTTSYWRNDRFGQPQPGTRSERQDVVCVSGVGDGALIDLIRVCLRGFKHDRLIDDLFDGLPLLIAKLHEIRELHLRQLISNPTSTLAEAFSLLHHESSSTPLGKEFKVFTGRLSERLRGDTHTLLNGIPSSFSHILAAKDRSFLNVVLAYCLYQAK